MNNYKEYLQTLRTPFINGIPIERVFDIRYGLFTVVAELQSISLPKENKLQIQELVEKGKEEKINEIQNLLN